MNTHMYGLAVYVKVGFPFAVANTLDSYLSFQQALLYSVPYLYLLHQSSFFALPFINHNFCMVFDTILSNIDGVLSSINISANVFIFGDLNIHHKD